MYERKKAQWNEADKKTALASQRLEQQKKILIEKCHRNDPMPKEDIQPVDFTAEIEKREYHCQELEEKQQFEQKRMVWYEENLTALAEFTEYMPEDEAQLWEMMRQDVDVTTGQEADMDGSPEMDTNPKVDGMLEATDGQGQSVTAEKIQELSNQRHALEIIGIQQAKIEQLQGKELRTKKGMLVRDYNHCKENRQKAIKRHGAPGKLCGRFLPQTNRSNDYACR